MRLSDLAQYNQITIQCHDNPDADAIASGYGLYTYFKKMNKDVRLVYCGRSKIQKSNLTLMVETLNIPIEYVSVGPGEIIHKNGLLITVDCQAGAGNVTGLTADVVAVIDHHQVENEERPISIINTSLGSCSTLVWKLLKEEGFPVDSDINLGTALYYGLYSDTNQFSEIYNPLDMDMREALLVDKRQIALFRNSNLSLKELEIAGIAMLRYSYNSDYKFAVIKAQPCDPNLLGLISDFLLQVDAIHTCVVFNESTDGYKFSVRSCIREVNASEMAAFIADDLGSGGGHYEKAGGFISLRRYEDRFPTMHTEGYFNLRMIEYFENYDIIYAEDYDANPEHMHHYVKHRLPVGYLTMTDLFPEGTNVTIRTKDGDLDLVVDGDLCIMIGVKGKVYPYSRNKLFRVYEISDEPYHLDSVDGKSFYSPVIKNRDNGKKYLLIDLVKACVPRAEAGIYARKLDKSVKVFTLWDNESYVVGHPGDYLAVRVDNPHDVYVIEKDIFDKGYEMVKS